MAKFSVRKSFTVFVVMIIIVVLGVISYQSMTPDLIPNINTPYVMLMTTYPGASPEKVETEVSKPLEQSMTTLENIKNISSQSSENYSVVTLEFSDDVNMDTITVDIMQNVDMIEGEWNELIGKPYILKINPSMMPVMVAAVEADNMETSDLSSLYSDEIESKLESVSGIGQISATGIVEKEANVIISNEKISAVNEKIATQTAEQMAKMVQKGQMPPSGVSAQSNGANFEDMLTVDTVSNILKAQNFAMPAGYVKQDGMDYLVHVGDEFESIDDVSNILIADLGIEGVDPIRLGDVAEVFIKDNSDSIYAKLNGKNSVVLTFTKQANFSTAEFSENMRSRFTELESKYDGINFRLLMDQGDYIFLIVDNIMNNILLGALFALIILFLFLRDIKPTIMVIFSIPISFFAAITAMYFSGVSINMISMSGLAVAIGMLVDNSVVVIENTYRLRSMGVSAAKAAANGASQVGSALVSSTLTTCSVFLPIIFVHGITRELFADMALTITYSLLASLLIAMSLVPAMSKYILRREPKQSKKGSYKKFLNVYGKALNATLNHKAVAVIIVVVLLLCSGYLAFIRGFSFMPEMNQPQVTLNVTTPDSFTFEERTALADEINSRVNEIKGVAYYGTTVTNDSGESGTRGFSAMGVGEGSDIYLYMQLDEDEDINSDEISKSVLAKCEGLEGEYEVTNGMDASSMMLGGSGIKINVYGENLDQMRDSAKKIAKELSTVEGTENVLSGTETEGKALEITVDKDAAMRNNLTTAQIYSEISNVMTTDQKSTVLRDSNDKLDVMVSTAEKVELTTDFIKSFEITAIAPNGSEVKVPLSEVAEINEAPTSQTISRENGHRYITVSSDIAKDYNVTLVTNDATDTLKELDLPSEISYEFSGENEEIVDSLKDLLKMLLLGILLVYLIMVAQFQSLKSPFIVMFTIPLAITGGLIALLICGYEVSVVSMIGFIMLAGLIVNNGIVLVDYINQLRASGIEKHEAIIKAGKTRLRPILMTALTTVASLLVMALKGGMGSEFIKPIAAVCIGGLVYATLLTLFIVPSLYDLMHKGEMHVITNEDLDMDIM